MKIAALALLALLAAGAAASDAVPNADAKVLHRANPVYPKAAAKKGVAGCVLVGFDVDAKGLADHYVVLDSQPKGVFDQATLKALNRWRWEKGKPGHQAQVISFQIDGKQKDAPRCAAPAVAQPAVQSLEVLQKVMPELSSVPEADQGGCVTVKMVIKHDGFVGDVTVLESRPAALAGPAVAALKQWWFQSFPPPDRTTVQTFYFTPDQVHLPDNAIRSPYLSLSGDGRVTNSGCGTSGTQG